MHIPFTILAYVYVAVGPDWYSTKCCCDLYLGHMDKELLNIFSYIFLISIRLCVDEYSHSHVYVEEHPHSRMLNSALISICASIASFP